MPHCIKLFGFFSNVTFISKMQVTSSISSSSLVVVIQAKSLDIFLFCSFCLCSSFSDKFDYFKLFYILVCPNFWPVLHKNTSRSSKSTVSLHFKS